MRILVLVVASMLLAGCTKPLSELKERENQSTGPGQAALEIIRAARVVVELDLVAGSEPNADALKDFEAEVEAVLGRPVDVVKTAEVSGRGVTHAYTLREINDLELRYRDRYTSGDTAVVYMLWLDGRFENEGTLGVAYHGTSIAMFKGTIRDNSKSDAQVLPTPGTLVLPREHFVERAVAVHEFGHVLGLVNNGIEMVRPHEMTTDPVPETDYDEGEAHSSNNESVMFWAVETAEVTNLFTNGEDIPWHFDSDDRADVARARG